MAPGVAGPPRSSQSSQSVEKKKSGQGRHRPNTSEAPGRRRIRSHRSSSSPPKLQALAQMPSDITRSGYTEHRQQQLRFAAEPNSAQLSSTSFSRTITTATVLCYRAATWIVSPRLIHLLPPSLPPRPRPRFSRCWLSPARPPPLCSPTLPALVMLAAGLYK